ncbi:MAG: hypothetical protein RLZZ519_1449, partial [Bacteroidota bacterium]
ADLDAVQPTKLADAVVDVRDVIARRDVLELFEGNCLTARSLRLALEAVVTLEDFVVGVEGKFKAFVEEATVDDGIDAREHRGFVDRCKNLVEPQKLIFAVGENEILDSNLLIFVEVLGEKVEFLFECRLGRTCPFDQLNGAFEEKSASKFHAGEAFHAFFECFGIGVKAFGTTAQGCSSTLGLQLLPIFARPLVLAIQIGGHEVHTLYIDNGAVAEVIEKMDLFFVDQVLLDVWDQRNVGVLILGNLIDRVKRANGFDLISKKFDAVREVIRKGKDIQNTATFAVCAWFPNKIAVIESVIVQDVDYEIHSAGFAFFQVEGVFDERTLVDHLLAQGLGKCDDELPSSLLMIQLIEDLGALQDIGIVDFLQLIRPLVTRWIIENFLLRHQGLEFVHEIERLLLVIENDEAATVHVLKQGNEQECRLAARKAFDLENAVGIVLDLERELHQFRMLAVDFKNVLNFHLGPWVNLGNRN